MRRPAAPTVAIRSPNPMESARIELELGNIPCLLRNIKALHLIFDRVTHLRTFRKFRWFKRPKPRRTPLDWDLKIDKSTSSHHFSHFSRVSGRMFKGQDIPLCPRLFGQPSSDSPARSFRTASDKFPGASKLLTLYDSRSTPTLMRDHQKAARN